MHREPVSPPSTFTTCYGCGKDNHLGLKLQFYREGESVVADFVPEKEHGGYGRVLHGGVTATLLDEAFGWALYTLKGRLGLTTELNVTYANKLECGRQLTLRATVETDDVRFGTLRAEILDHQGKVAAIGVGRMRYISRRLAERMGGFSTDMEGEGEG